MFCCFFFKCVQILIKRHAMHICLPVWLAVVHLVVEVWRGRATNRLQRWQCGGIIHDMPMKLKLVRSTVACSTLRCAHAVFLALSVYSLPLLCVRGCAGGL